MKDKRMFNAPMSRQRATYLVEALDLAPSAHVVDFGCGHGAFLRLIASYYQIQGVGVDNNPELIQQATHETSNENMQDNLTFVDADATEHLQKMSPVDAIVCIGAEYIFGGYRQLLQLAKPKLKPAGKLLVGLVYWKQPPPADYLQATGMEGDLPYFDLLSTVSFAREQGYIPLEVHRSNDDEWDMFESATARQRYETAMETNDTALHEKTWQWHSAYLRWGVNVMGFCYLILQKI